MKYRITYARVEPNPILGEPANRYVTAVVVDAVLISDGILHGFREGGPAVILPAGAWLSVEGVEE